jgi:hypothetical protein
MPKKIKLLSIEEDKVSVVDETGAEVPNEPETVPVVVEAPITDIEEVPQPAPKEKPKRPSRAKPKKIEEEELNIVIPIEAAALPVAAIAPEPEKPKENIKTIELVPCPKCNKKITAKTLKYTHEEVCPAMKQTEQPEQPEEDTRAKPASRAKPVAAVPPQPEPPVHERVRRMNNRTENYKNVFSANF